MKKYRNKYVVQRKSGHPGYVSTKIFATREDLATMADEIKAICAEGYVPPPVSDDLAFPGGPKIIRVPRLPHVFRRATEAHGQSSRVYLEFEPVTEEQMDNFHQPDISRGKPLLVRMTKKFRGWFALLVILFFLLSAFVGATDLIRRLLLWDW